MTTIYALIDPRTSELRYVGKSIKLRQRFDSHKRIANGTPVSLWVFGLLPLGLEPELVTLEEVNDRSAKESESFWISYFRSLGSRLLNAHGVPENMRWDRRCKDRTWDTPRLNRSIDLS